MESTNDISLYLKRFCNYLLQEVTQTSNLHRLSVYVLKQLSSIENDTAVGFSLQNVSNQNQLKDSDPLRNREMLMQNSFHSSCLMGDSHVFHNLLVEQQQSVPNPINLQENYPPIDSLEFFEDFLASYKACSSLSNTNEEESCKVPMNEPFRLGTAHDNPSHIPAVLFRRTYFVAPNDDNRRVVTNNFPMIACDSLEPCFSNIKDDTFLPYAPSSIRGRFFPHQDFDAEVIPIFDSYFKRKIMHHFQACKDANECPTLSTKFKHVSQYLQDVMQTPINSDMLQKIYTSLPSACISDNQDVQRSLDCSSGVIDDLFALPLIKHYITVIPQLTGFQNLNQISSYLHGFFNEPRNVFAQQNQMYRSFIRFFFMSSVPLKDRVFFKNTIIFIRDIAQYYSNDYQKIYRGSTDLIASFINLLSSVLQFIN